MSEIKYHRPGSPSNNSKPPPTRVISEPATQIPRPSSASEPDAAAPPDVLAIFATLKARVPPGKQPDVMQVLRKFGQCMEGPMTALHEALPHVQTFHLFDISCSADSAFVVPETARKEGAAADFDVRYAPDGRYTINELEAVLDAAAEVYGAQIESLTARLASVQPRAAGTRPRVRVVIDLSRVVVEEEHVLEDVDFAEPAESKTPTPTSPPPPPFRRPVNGHTTN